MSNQKVNYHDYLSLDHLLHCQQPLTKAHDEMLFIVIHQAYELWFKLVLHEVDSVWQMFAKESVDEEEISVIVARMGRVLEIMKLLVDQVRIIETMTPLDFLDFRDALHPASGFQSFQFRLLEVKLGLQREQRVAVPQQQYHIALKPEQQKQLLEAESQTNLFTLINQWLERLPFLEYRTFNFVEQYMKSIEAMFDREREGFMEDKALFSDKEYEARLAILEKSQHYIQSLLHEDTYNKLLVEGEVRLSYNAMLAALMINLYRDQPILHLPFQFLNQLTELDELIATWRHRHSVMARKMLGKKIGTGGSAGYDYLRQTVYKHTVFSDFANLASLFIPRRELPKLPLDLIHKLGFHYSYTVNPTGERVKWYPRTPDPSELA